MAGAVLVPEPTGEVLPLRFVGDIKFTHLDPAVGRRRNEIGPHDRGTRVRRPGGDRRAQSLGGSGHDDDSVAEAHRAVKAPSTG